MKHKIFVDGQEGTTGLKINERLEKRADIEIIKIDPEKRKDTDERKKLLNEADIAFLCLPDAAAKESVSLIENDKTRIIDASTAHRTNPDWAYGLPELSSQHRSGIKSSKRVAVPGCYATGFNLLLYPLVKEGLMPADYPVTCNAVSGYSGGGKKLIEKFDPDNPGFDHPESPRLYSFGLTHKHVPEMQNVSELAFAPLFAPSISNFYKGMLVSVPLLSRLLPGKQDARALSDFFASYYNGQKFVEVIPYESEACLSSGYLDAIGCNDTNKAQLFVFGNKEQVLLVARLDNLGKGASGAAVQCMNIMLGIDEAAGLE